MKKIIYLFLIAFSVSLTSCFDTEEKINLNEDGSGTYGISLDMSKLMGMFSAIGGEKKKQEKKDTTIYFKDYSDTSGAFTQEEKEILHTGKASIKANSETGEMRIDMDAGFKNQSQLIYLRNHLPEMANKMNIKDKLNDKKQKNPDNNNEETVDLTPKMGTPGKNNFNPFSEYYSFTSTNNSLSYKITNKQAAQKALETNEDLKTFKKVLPMLGDATVSTKITLPRAAKKAEGPNAKLSDDKKTVTVATTFKELFKNIEAMTFTVEY